MSLEITKIDAEFHDLPGIGTFEYLFNNSSKVMIIYLDGVEILRCEGDSAIKLNKDCKGELDKRNPYESVLDRKCMAVFGHGIDKLKVIARFPELVERRQICLHYLYYHSRLTHAKAASIFNQNHAMVDYARKEIDKIISVDMNLKRTVELFKKA